ncbi:MAG: hypothetical protein WBP26_03835 [Candidatus Saccharimonadales bacterium]
MEMQIYKKHKAGDKNKKMSNMPKIHVFTMKLWKSQKNILQLTSSKNANILGADRVMAAWAG